MCRPPDLNETRDWHPTHRNLERRGEGWQGVREGVAGDQGWPLYLQRYASLFASEH